MRRALLTTIAAATAFCSVALAGDLSVTVSHPALAGYCVQTLRHALSQMQQAMSSCKAPITPQQCDEIMRPLRTIQANQQRTFDLWRIYGLGLGLNSASEFLRGAAEANADIAYLTTFVAAHPFPLSASQADIEKASKAAAASDPRIQAIQGRVAECRRGPPL